MPKGILLVRSRPESPDTVADLHHWYNEVHIPEILTLAGFVSARRLQAADDGESYLAVYEVDDVATARAAMAEAQGAGKMTRPSGVLLDPPPSAEWFTDLAD
jgi:hypothetical protein